MRRESGAAPHIQRSGGPIKPETMSSRDIEEMMEALRAERHAAEDEIDRLEAGPKSGILGMPDAELEAIEAAVTKVELRRSRAIKRYDEAKALLPIALEREQEDERREAYADASAARAEIDRLIDEELHPLTASIQTLLERIAPLNQIIARHRAVGSPEGASRVETVDLASLVNLPGL
jgi:hypothetical protein